MKRHWIDYADRWTRGPMTYWVHVETDAETWRDAKRFEPPAPKPIPGRGYPKFHVEIDGFEFQFSSLQELDACIETLSKKVLPTSQRLSAERGTGCGPNQHWLSRLPANVKSWRYRQKAVKFLRKAKTGFETELGSAIGSPEPRSPGEHDDMVR